MTASFENEDANFFFEVCHAATEGGDIYSKVGSSATVVACFSKTNEGGQLSYLHRRLLARLLNPRATLAKSRIATGLGAN